MPKNRSSTIGSGASGTGPARPGNNSGTANVGGIGGAGSSEELAGRIMDRLQEVRTVNVPVYSQNRGLIEDTPVTFNPDTPGMATVISGSGSQYQVDYNNDECTCINHRVRGGRCRHIEATHQAMGQVSSELMSQNTPAGETSVPGEEMLSNQIQLDSRDEDRRRDIQNVEVDDGYFYTENEEEFENTMERLGNEQPEYEYENVLNGSQITFGLEIEFVDGDADAIARELYDMGICGYNNRVHYHSPSISGKWKLERDGSVSSGNSGGELVSPVLRDTPETWQNIEKICEVAKRHGARVNHKCGGHVHVGMDPLDTAKQRWKRFFKIMAGFEDVAYRIAGGSEGRVRSGYSQYAVPFRERAATAVRSSFTLENENDISDLARRVSGRNRYYGINLTNIYDSDRPNTVEFRHFNSSLDAGQLQANVKFANGIMMAAEKARTRERSESAAPTSENMKKRGSLLKDHPMGTNSHSDHSAVKKLVDILFTRKTDKDRIISVYSKNQWAFN